MEFARATIGFELESLWMNPNPDHLVMEMIHAVSYIKPRFPVNIL